MSITATDRKDVFVFCFPMPESVENRTSVQEIVCYVRLNMHQLEINYAYHLLRSRDASSGPYSQPTRHRLSLTPLLRAVCVSGVYQELLNQLSPIIRTSPAPIESSVNEIEF